MTGWDAIVPTSECLHCMGSGLVNGGGDTECGFCEQDRYFLLFPSSNNARHLVTGPFPSILAARSARIVSGNLVVQRLGDAYVAVQSFNALFDWELQEAAFPSGDYIATPFAFRHAVSKTAWSMSDCETPNLRK